jgi:hypothetical protein
MPSAARKPIEMSAPSVPNHCGTAQWPAAAETPSAMAMTTAPWPSENSVPQ